MSIYKTVRLKVRPEAYPWLEQAADEVNQVWNWANETSYRAIRPFAGSSRFLSGYDLGKLAAGSSVLFRKINANIIERTVHEFAAKRVQAKKTKLSWRVGSGRRRSLGWVPFKGDDLRRIASAVRCAGKTFRFFDSASLGEGKFRQGCFAQDAVGDWWFCMAVINMVKQNVAPANQVGIDLGLKAIATTSDGDVLEAGRWTERAADRLAAAQRRGHKRQAKRIHRKTARTRADAIHKFTTAIVAKYQNIVIGDVSSAKLVKTRMAKSVLDSGWAMLKTQLHYKGEYAGRSVSVVDEAYTTRACSNCGQLTGPKGLRQLAVREWSCECGVTHDRDVNAARNILRLRHQPPFAGTRVVRKNITTVAGALLVSERETTR